MKIGVMFGNPETTTGGNALKFYASVRMDIRRIETIKDGTDVDRQPGAGQGGQEQGGAAVPRRPSSTSCTTRASRSRAACSTSASRLGIVRKSGAWFSFGDERLGQGRENAKEFLQAQPGRAGGDPLADHGGLA